MGDLLTRTRRAVRTCMPPSAAAAATAAASVDSSSSSSNDDQLDALWALFRRIDKSRDGKISLRELNQSRKRSELNIGSDEARAVMRFSDEDENGNKLLSFPAFYVATTGLKLQARYTPSLLKAFTSLYMNNDGYVDAKDLIRAAEAGLQLSRHDMREFLMAADVTPTPKCP
jgi:Ca2+-binding EF-hand superfamily protein